MLREWLRRVRGWARVVREVPRPRLPLDTERWRQVRAQGKRAAVAGRDAVAERTTEEE